MCVRDTYINAVANLAKSTFLRNSAMRGAGVYAASGTATVHVSSSPYIYIYMYI